MTALIGFSTRPANPLSAFIRWVTGAQCSHAWLLINESYFGIPMVMEATEWGIRVIDASIFWKRNKVVCVFKPKVDLTDSVKSSGKLLGGMYDFAGLFGEGLVQLAARWLKRTVKNPLASSSAMFCSEMVVTLMKQSAYPGMESMAADSISPEELRQFLEKELDLCIHLPDSAAKCFGNVKTLKEILGL